MSNDLYIEGLTVAPVVKALSNDARLKILNLLSDQDMNVQALAKRLNLSKTAVLTHVNILEEAGFIKSQYLSGSIGNQRICHKVYDRLIFNFDPGKSSTGESTYYETRIPVGNYFDFEAWSPCGLASQNSIIKKWDDPAVFCDPQRVEACIVWTSFGYVEYKIPVDALFADKKVTALEMELEISAQHNIKDHKNLVIPPYRTREQITDDLSHITFWINQKEAGSVLIPVGKDPEKATYTPSWWRSLPIHGFRVSLRIDAEGCYVNQKKTSSLSFEEMVGSHPFFRFRVGVKPDAPYSGGFTIFGRQFGAYSHDIILKSFIE